MGGTALVSFLSPIIIPSLSLSKRLRRVVPRPRAVRRPLPSSCLVVVPPVAIVVPPVALLPHVVVVLPVVVVMLPLAVVVPPVVVPPVALAVLPVAVMCRLSPCCTTLPLSC
jgi:hypothetical protein